MAPLCGPAGAGSITSEVMPVAGPGVPCLGAGREARLQAGIEREPGASEPPAREGQLGREGEAS